MRVCSRFVPPRLSGYFTIENRRKPPCSTLVPGTIDNLTLHISRFVHPFSDPIYGPGGITPMKTMT